MRILTYLSIIIVFNYSCKKHKIFQVEDTSMVSKQIKFTSGEKIDTVYDFIIRVLESYQETVNELNVSHIFKDSFELLNEKEISADYYLSTYNELLIEIYKSKDNTFTVFGTSMPVQSY
ncbi:MAG TPA: hypothetical protein VL832_23195, partial [Puia sp.]|nr:hypothetical protein [Puia sp.]